MKLKKQKTHGPAAIITTESSPEPYVEETDLDQILNNPSLKKEGEKGLEIQDFRQIKSQEISKWVSPMPQSFSDIPGLANLVQYNHLATSVAPFIPQKKTYPSQLEKK